MRHARQARLADVGAAGQARLAAATATVRGQGLAALVEARYLAGAGVGALRVADAALAGEARAVDPAAQVRVDASLAAVVDDALPFEVRDPSARAVAAGAQRALSAFRNLVLGEGAR